MFQRALIVGLSVLFFLPVQHAFADQHTPSDAHVYIIPIEGMIEDALVYMIRRGIREAEARQVRAIVFVMNTDGGKLDSADEIVGLLLKLKVPTYTYVKHRAFSAGAMIALATDHIYMAPGSVIGAAMPVMMTPFGGAAEMPASVEEKIVSATSALIRTAAQQKGHNAELAEAMVRPGSEFTAGGKVQDSDSRLLTLTNFEAEQPYGDDGKPLLSAGTSATLDEMLHAAGLSGSPLLELEISSAEHLARFISMISFLLLGAGLLAIYIEIKTPGFGLPGIIGAICLAIFFWGHHVAGLAGLEDIVIFALGLALLLVEVFVLPGFGIAGIAGLAMVGVALFRAMLPQLPTWQVVGPGWPPLLAALRQTSMGFVLAFGGALLAARFLPQTRSFKGLTLQTEVARASGYTSLSAPTVQVGDQGRTLTPLRPFGAALFGDSRIEVASRNEMVEADVKIRVVEIKDSRIIVEPEV